MAESQSSLGKFPSSAAVLVEQGEVLDKPQAEQVSELLRVLVLRVLEADSPKVTGPVKWPR